MNTHTLLGTAIKKQSKTNILEKVEKYIHNPYSFFHIVSLNPENIMIGVHDEEFRNILSEGDIQLIDGAGVALGCAFLGIETGERVAGSDFMEIMLKYLDRSSLRVLLLGGRSNLAEELAKCYQQKYPQMQFSGMEGFRNVRKPSATEMEHIFTYVADYKPQIVFSAFGSPDQEEFFSRHKREFAGIICMGVGGGFDFAVGNISRAPVLMRKIGLEWLFRLVREPWRWRRQLRIWQFVWQVFLQKYFR